MKKIYIDDLTATRNLIKEGKITRLSQVSFDLLRGMTSRMHRIGAKGLRNRLRNADIWSLKEIKEMADQLNISTEKMVDLVVAEYNWQQNRK